MDEPALLTVLLRMAIGLAVVLALIVACAWLARRAGWLPVPSARLLRQIDQLSLGPRSHITVVAVQDSWLVLGVTAGQITLLHCLPAPTDPASAMPAPGASVATASSVFANLLQTIRRRPPHARTRVVAAS